MDEDRASGATSKPAPIDLGILTAIAARYGLARPCAVPQPWIGASSRVYPLGDVVIKIPFATQPAIDAVRIDATVGPVGRALGVTTPEVVAFDDRLDMLPMPFAIVRRVAGAVPLAGRPPGDEAWRKAWHEVGRHIALVHQVSDMDAVPTPLRVFRQTPEVDPRPWVDELAVAGILPTPDARWLQALLETLAPHALADVPRALCHGDVNAANVLVDEGAGVFRALIDWAGAGWLDPVWDFAGVPLDAVPAMLQGHREVAPLPFDATAEARICWCQIQARLFATRSVRDDVTASHALSHHLAQARSFARWAKLA